MSGEAWLYLIAVLINAVNLFLQVFFTIMYSDLEWFVSHPSHRLAVPNADTLLPQRLHQPYRPLQPPQHLHRPRSCCPRFPHHSLPRERLLDRLDPQLAAPCLERKEVSPGFKQSSSPKQLLTRYRIFENQHLLDATEIFRKLNVHKKVCFFAPPTFSHCTKLIQASGIFHQARLPPGHVLLLPLQHDRRPHPRRVALNSCYHTTPINNHPTSISLPLRLRHAVPRFSSRRRARLSSLAGWCKMKKRNVHVMKIAHIWVAFLFTIHGDEV